MKRGIRKAGWGIAWSIVLLLAGCATAPRAQVSFDRIPFEQQERARENVRVFRAAWDLVNRKHYDPKFQGVDWEAAAARYLDAAARARDEEELYGAINGMLGLLKDSHTFALSPAQAQERRTRMRVRTGFAVTRIEEKWVVTEVMPQSPAAEAGVKEGWIVVALNGEAIGDRFVLVPPREGAELRWEFIDEEDRRITLVPIARKLTIAPRQVARTLEDGFVYLRFDEFDGRDRRWLSRQLKEHAEAPGVVVDLRRNPGGDTFSLGTVIGEFFPRAVDCGTFITRAGVRRVKNSWQFGSANYRGKVVLLVDGGTGSAAEIFAAVMQDHGRATVVGRRTAGAVLASWFYRLPGGGELQLSREDYVAPKGRRIEGHGIEPDIQVKRTLDDARRGRDPDLEAALHWLRGDEISRDAA